MAKLKIFHALNNLITGKFEKTIKITSLHSPHVQKRKFGLYTKQAENSAQKRKTISYVSIVTK